MSFFCWSNWQTGADKRPGPKLNSCVHIQQWYCPLTLSPDAITILETRRASRLLHNTININVLWLRRLWKNFLPHQYWWCCHTLGFGPFLRIYKKNAGEGGVFIRKGPKPFLVGASVMYILLLSRAISAGKGWLRPTLDEIWDVSNSPEMLWRRW